MSESQEFVDCRWIWISSQEFGLVSESHSQLLNLWNQAGSLPRSNSLMRFLVFPFSIGPDVSSSRCLCNMTEGCKTSHSGQMRIACLNFIRVQWFDFRSRNEFVLSSNLVRLSLARDIFATSHAFLPTGLIHMHGSLCWVSSFWVCELRKWSAMKFSCL